MRMTAACSFLLGRIAPGEQDIYYERTLNVTL